MEHLLPIVSSFLALLLAGNVYFVKRLVEKIDVTASSATNALNSMGSIAQNVNSVSTQLKELKNDIKDLRRLEIDVAMLKVQMNGVQMHGNSPSFSMHSAYSTTPKKPTRVDDEDSHG